MPGCLPVYTVLFELPDQIATDNFFLYSNLHIFYNLKNDCGQIAVGKVSVRRKGFVLCCAALQN